MIDKIKQAVSNPHVLFVSLILLVISLGSVRLMIQPLVWGDYDWVTAASKQLNIESFLYMWTGQNFGTSPRTSFGTIMPLLATQIPGIPDTAIYIFLRILPLFLIPLVTYWVIVKLTNNKFIAFTTSIVSVINPVVMGDVLNGQTLWIYPVVLSIFYFWIRVFYNHQFTLANSISISLLLFLAMALLSPIVVPLAVVLAILSAVALPNLLASRVTIIQCTKHTVMILGVLILLIFPYLLAAPSGQQAYAAPSTVADYYHNYSETIAINLFRFAGNAGNGQQTLGYNSSSVSNDIGYSIIFLTILGSIGLSTATRRGKERTATLAFMLMFLILIGFIHVISVNTDLGSKLFQSQWIVGTIRNPAKLFILILELEIILLAFSLKNIQSVIKPKHTKLLLYSILMCVFIYGWPVLGGDFGLSHGAGLNKRAVGTLVPAIINDKEFVGELF